MKRTILATLIAALLATLAIAGAPMLQAFYVGLFLGDGSQTIQVEQSSAPLSSATMYPSWNEELWVSIWDHDERGAAFVECFVEIRVKSAGTELWHVTGTTRGIIEYQAGNSTVEQFSITPSDIVSLPTALFEGIGTTPVHVECRVEHAVWPNTTGALVSAYEVGEGEFLFELLP